MAAVRCFNREIVSEFSTLVKFDGELSSKITEITGIKKSDLKDAIDEKTAFQILNRFIGNSIIVAHNAGFDMGFLHYSLMRLAGRSFENDFIDTLTIARARYQYPHTLTEMCCKLEIELNGAHRALNDVIGCFEVLKKMHLIEPVDEFVNKLGYKAKYGKPKWSPNKAVLISQ
jgi:DNA polymerase-3 subunit epsilon/DNA polymerase-3 subunit alpha (Gram-positive type)